MSELNAIKSLTIEDKLLEERETRRTERDLGGKQTSDKIISLQAINFKAISFINWICRLDVSQVASERGSKSAVKQLVRRCLIAFCAVTTLFLMFPIDTFSTINIQFIFVLYLHSRLSVESDRVRAPSKLAINRLTPNNLLYRMFYFSFAPFFFSSNKTRASGRCGV